MTPITRALYDSALKNMESTLDGLARCVPAPQRVPMLDSFVFRYVEKSIHQAIIQKLARIVSGLHAKFVCFLITVSRRSRARYDDFEEDVVFLCCAIIYDDFTGLHRRYLEAFYEEEFDKPGDPVGSSQQRPMIPRQKIQAYLARVDSGLDRGRALEVARTLSKAYSGYVHGASPHIMDMYGGSPPRFHVSGLRESLHNSDHEGDLWNYFYRGICAFGFAAKAFGHERLFASILEFRDDFAQKTGGAEKIGAPIA